MVEIIPEFKLEVGDVVEFTQVPCSKYEDEYKFYVQVSKIENVYRLMCIDVDLPSNMWLIGLPFKVHTYCKDTKDQWENLESLSLYVKLAFIPIEIPATNGSKIEYHRLNARVIRRNNLKFTVNESCIEEIN